MSRLPKNNVRKVIISAVFVISASRGVMPPPLAADPIRRDHSVFDPQGGAA